MIQRIPGWTWTPRGGCITLARPDGGAQIRYRERQRPLRSVASILRERAADARFRATSTGEVELVVTAEGEYAAIVEISGVLDAPPSGGSPVRLARTLGFVFADDWYSEVAGMAMRSELVAPMTQWVRKLVDESRLMLGIRRRRFVYARPPGWHGHTRLPLYATWFPPGYPGDPTSITVYPALPVPASDEEPHFGMFGIGPPATAEIAAELVPRTTVSRAGLTGCRWRFLVRDEKLRWMHRDVILLRDARYLYASYLDRDAATATDADPGLRAYEQLVDSICPIPAPRAAPTAEPLASEWF